MLLVLGMSTDAMFVSKAMRLFLCKDLEKFAGDNDKSKSSFRGFYF